MPQNSGIESATVYPNGYAPEFRTIECRVYRTKEGNPTCIKDVMTGEYCEFFRTSKFGTREQCLFEDSMPLTRYGPGGFLRPGEWCPLWHNDRERNKP